MNRSAPAVSLPFAVLREQAHPRCVVCGPAHPHGLQLACVPQPDGSVEAVFAGEERFEGYPDQLHGGIAAALLDGAMTNCLFARGIEAVTAELRIRYRHPLTTNTRVTVRARILETHPPLYRLRAELRQNGQVKVLAEGKFMPRPTDSTTASKPS